MTAVPVRTAPRGQVSEAAAHRLVKVVDHDAIRHNVAVLRAAADGRRLLPVIKGDAYGLGAVPVARTLVAAGVDGLAVDTVAEGLALRAAGITHPVLVMDVDTADNAAACVDAGLTPSVARPEHARRYAELAARRPEPLPVWLRTNVGFNRFGPRDGFPALLDALAPYRGPLRFAGLFAHLSASAWGTRETDAEAAEFAARLAATRARFGGDVTGSLAATHGLLHPSALAGTDAVRPGIGVYGSVASTARLLPGWPSSGLARLRPAWQVRARVLDVVTTTRTEGLGYDRDRVLPPGRRVASVAVGFSRGIRSTARLGGLLHGVRCPAVGAPGMDCTQFDVTDVPDVREGDWVTLLDGTRRTADDLAEELGCSLYELMATLSMPVRHDHGED